jgi:hypothetical protein
MTHTTHIEDRDAWERGRDRAIKRNASVSRQRKWLAEDASRQELIDLCSDHFGGSDSFPLVFNEDCAQCRKHFNWEWKATPDCDGHANEVVKSAWRASGAFLDAMDDQINEWGRLSEKQEAAVRKILERAKGRVAEWEVKLAEEFANSADCPQGRVQVVGTVLSVKDVETNFGNVWKMLVRDDSGFKVWGSMPRKLREPEDENGQWLAAEELKGKRVSFTAAVEPSEDDQKFGFFKRPTKAKIEAAQ